MNSILLLSGLLLLILFYLFSVYNKFVTIKTRVKASIQEIGNQLKRQANLIPNLIASVKGYMKHEKEVFQDITEARKMIVSAVQAGDAQKMMAASDQTIKALAPIRAVFESTPQLKAVETVTKLMDELRDTADKVMYSRRTLIDLTADYNTMIAVFPSNLIAKMFNFKQEAGLKMPEGAKKEAVEVKKEELKTPKVKLD